MSKKKAKKKGKWTANKVNRDALDGRFLGKPRAVVKKIAEVQGKAKVSGFKSEVKKLTKKSKLSSKIGKKRLK